MNPFTPNHIVGKSLGEAWLLYNQAVLRNCTLMIDDREDIYEIGPTSVVLEDVNRNDHIISKYGDSHIIDLYVKKMFSMEVIKELNSTYGDRIFSNNGIDQFDWMISRLKGKWWTKAASISLLKPNDPGPRIPCLTQLQVVIRNDKLYMHSIFRSQNVYRSYGNFIGIRVLQEIAAERLGIGMGSIHSYCICPHIYKSDIEKAKEAIDALSKNT